MEVSAVLIVQQIVCQITVRQREEEEEEGEGKQW